MVAIKNLSITSAVVLGLSGQVQAAPMAKSDLATRSGADSDLDVRDPFLGRIIGSVFGGRKGRRDLEELTERDLDELETRDPFLGRIIGSVFGGRRGRRDLEELSERDIDQLEERSPRSRGSGLARHAISTAGKVGVAWANNQRRDLEELSERDLDELEERDLDDLDLETRDPFLGRIIGSVFGGRRGRRDLEELSERDIDELEERDLDLEARDPFLGRIIGSVFGGRRGRRDLEELVSRDLELEERSPRSRGSGLARHAISTAGKVGVAWANNQRRDLDSESLVARELENLDERDLEYLYALYLRDMEDSEE
ncbi:unnamed protein product [Clonostachys solani]|uniref:Uncharacterized protein n=1 Tax=Clonostachys solani TaxID=160281 RepID=A0A9N9ZI58_9HYPO|nr:unnamed protein product [Clonostachys solani]